jgi:hypothetical protein
VLGIDDLAGDVPRTYLDASPAQPGGAKVVDEAGPLTMACLARTSFDHETWTIAASAHRQERTPPGTLHRADRGMCGHFQARG